MNRILYHSTIGNSLPVSAAKAILSGTTPDGGLYVPDRLPVLTADDLAALLPLSYPRRAASILARLLPDFTEAELLDDCIAAYKDFSTPIAPLRKDLSVLELWQGPSCTCKDVSEAIFPRLLSRAQAKYGSSVIADTAYAGTIGRLLPRIVPFVSAYCDLVVSGKLAPGERLDIAVPTGNFSSILAAWLAKKMGLPLGKLIAASNANNVIADFLATGTYDSNRSFRTTLSPAIDVLRATDVERLLYFIAGADRCRAYMDALSRDGIYTVEASDFDAIRTDFDGDYCSDEACLDRIASTHLRYGYLIDPHTAIALTAAERYLCGNESDHMLVVSTASPYRFATTVARALGVFPIKDEQTCIDALTKAVLHK